MSSPERIPNFFHWVDVYAYLEECLRKDLLTKEEYNRLREMILSSDEDNLAVVEAILEQKINLNNNKNDKKSS